MEVDIRPVSVDEKEILRNLLEKYNYEFSQWDGLDVNSLGLYGYSYLDHYWTEKNRWAYFVRVNGKLAGFAMINDYAVLARKTDFAIAEFSILPKYRRLGIGKQFALALMQKHRGTWQLKRHPKNLPSVAFWDAVAQAASSAAVEKLSSMEATYDDGSPADVLYFDSFVLPQESI